MRDVLYCVLLPCVDFSVFCVNIQMLMRFAEVSSENIPFIYFNLICMDLYCLLSDLFKCESF